METFAKEPKYITGAYVNTCLVVTGLDNRWQMQETKIVVFSNMQKRKLPRFCSSIFHNALLFFLNVFGVVYSEL